MQTVQLNVPTINCEKWVARIRTTLVERRGVDSVEGDPARKEITVRFDPAAVGDAEIRAAIEAAGFAVA